MGTPFSAADLTRGAGEREWGTGNGELEEGVVWLVRGVNVAVSMGSDPMEEKCSQLCSTAFIPLPYILPFLEA